MSNDFYLWDTQQDMLSMYFPQILFLQIRHQSIWLLSLTEQEMCDNKNVVETTNLWSLKGVEFVKVSYVYIQCYTPKSLKKIINLRL